MKGQLYYILKSCTEKKKKQQQEEQNKQRGVERFQADLHGSLVVNEEHRAWWEDNYGSQ